MNRFDAGRHHRALAGPTPSLRRLAGVLLLAVASATTVAATSGCAGIGPHSGGSQATDWPRSGGFSAEALKRIDDYVNTDIAGGKIPGAALVIVRDDRVIHERLWGVRDPATRAPMTMDTIFRIYSMTKPITSVAAMMLVEEGRLGLQDPVSQYIPAFRDVKVGVEKKGADGKLALELEAPKRQMTIQDLLRHTSGLTYGFFGEGLVKNAYSRRRPVRRRRRQPRVRRTAGTAAADVPAGHDLGVQPRHRRPRSRDRGRQRQVAGRVLQRAAVRSAGNDADRFRRHRSERTAAAWPSRTPTTEHSDLEPSSSTRASLPAGSRAAVA